MFRGDCAWSSSAFNRSYSSTDSTTTTGYPCLATATGSARARSINRPIASPLGAQAAFAVQPVHVPYGLLVFANGAASTTHSGLDSQAFRATGKEFHLGIWGATSLKEQEWEAADATARWPGRPSFREGQLSEASKYCPNRRCRYLKGRSLVCLYPGGQSSRFANIAKGHRGLVGQAFDRTCRLEPRRRGCLPAVWRSLSGGRCGGRRRWADNHGAPRDFGASALTGRGVFCCREQQANKTAISCAIHVTWTKRERKGQGGKPRFYRG